MPYKKMNSEYCKDGFNYHDFTKQGFKDLETIVVRLIGLPRIMSTGRKKDKKYATKVMKDIILPKLGEMIEKTEVTEFFDESIDPAFQMQGYLELLDKGKYKKAEMYAINWLRTIRWW